MNVDPFQIFDVLDKTSFHQLLEKKYDNYGLGKTSVFTIDDPWKNYFETDIDEVTRDRVGIYSKIYNRVEEALISKGFSNPEICKFGYTNSTGRMEFAFHKHIMHPSINSYKPYIPHEDKIGKDKFAVPFTHFWVAIFYPHDVYEKEGHGDLYVKRDKEDTNPYVFPSVPNSIVLHDGNFGHELKFTKVVPNKIRDAIFTHWLCKYPS
jgi:hypothetical protein